ncbi:(deoxy)nucleoside triphosphate pyrophosphohydrolase [Nocardioides marmorisolisilvae]|uniref:8-oxo-dGTP diphosphatase n=1 Tax=Nocardioides marmorisolisilvae TaxID=1542737 RepID=A0A3N0DYX6_9ACTN|nr:(deoxy)nucleoside triphosphate pyrophosphohydrolase [Nocardioides marmorisolisilvae]RNL80814.1 (deoxy)nucleoside triphosphate pyrophosphohydrolase [Nocardioides marmorisolisilvae]
MTLVVGVAIVRSGRVLAARRSGGGWEFPGGKVEPGEAPEDAAVREIAEELGCGIEVTGWLEGEVEIRPDLALRVARALLVGGEPIPRPGEHDAIRWLSHAELDAVDWLPADRPFLGVLGTL